MSADVCDVDSHGENRDSSPLGSAMNINSLSLAPGLFARAAAM